MPQKRHARRGPVASRTASVTRPISSIRSCVVPSIEVTSPDIGTGFRPWPSKSKLAVT
jgi:hypothetical protein